MNMRCDKLAPAKLKKLDTVEILAPYMDETKIQLTVKGRTMTYHILSLVQNARNMAGTTISSRNVLN